MLQIKCAQTVPCFKAQQMQMQAAVYLFVGKQVAVESCCSVCAKKG